MDGPRQPPDGHEFPDLEKPIVEHKMPVIEQQIVEKPPPPPPVKPRDSWMSKYEPQVNNVRDKIAIFSKPQTTLTKKYVSTSSIPTDSSTLGKDKDEFRSSSTSLFRKNSISDSPPSFQTPRYRTSASITPEYKPQSNLDTVTLRRKPETPAPRLHNRSVSLLDINDNSNSNRLDRWSLLIEQRRLSKLKGLVIPEHEPETDSINKQFVDLPEIQSIVVPPVITRAESKINEAPIISRRHSSISNFQIPQIHHTPQIAQPKSNDSSTFPKYSPAFKKRSFQIHSSFNTVPSDTLNVQTKHTNTSSINSSNISLIAPEYNPDVKKVSSPIKTRDFSNFTVNTSISSDPPKSLESITSPTRSDYSFDFNHVPQTRNPNTDLTPLNSKDKIINARPNSYVSDVIGSSEYESDTDSALSSSQSSYISKNSPPASPIHTRNDSLNEVHKRSLPSPQTDSNVNYESLNRRLLKPQSLEAINRKNILASARCRSGRDLKVGSPLIQRKFEDNDVVNAVELPKALPNGSVQSTPVLEEEKPIVEEKFTIEPVKNEIVSEPEKVPSPKTRVENLNLPKVILSDVKSNIIEKPIEPVKRNFANSDYYSPNKPVVRRASSVTDLRKNFEKVAPTPAKRNSINSIITSTPTVQPQPIKRTSLPQITHTITQVNQKDSAKPLTTVDNVKNNYDKLIENAIIEFDENISKSDVKVVNLKPDVDGGSLGITLAGGSDYETKEITIHKIRDGSPAFRDGRLHKGDKILAINGKYMKGLSHSQSLRALKENVPEAIIIACRGNESNSTVTSPKISSRPVSFEMSKEVSISSNDDIIEATNTISTPFEVSIMKDATGLGFSIQGGKSSPQGDIPLVIKKIFMGGAAEKILNLKADDELLEINHVDVTCMSRMEVWNLMKKLPEQEITIKVRR